MKQQSAIFQPGGKRRVILSDQCGGDLADSSWHPLCGGQWAGAPESIQRSQQKSRDCWWSQSRKPVPPSAAGAAGRVSDGVCFRLFDEQHFQQLDEFTDPEILRTNLGSVILQMLVIGLGSIEDFPFLDPPAQKQINDGFGLLVELGAIDEGGALTKTGREMASLPIDLRLARVMLSARDKNCVTEALVLCSFLSGRDPRAFASRKASTGSAGPCSVQRQKLRLRCRA